jgi:beta-N-acetylhexosaminidase
MVALAFITGISGTTLTAGERTFLRAANPWGCILFKRNIDTPEQVRALTNDFRETVGRDAPVLVDQEGGRVQRLGPPHWPAYPPGAAYGRVCDAAGAVAGQRAAWLAGQLIGADLQAVGIDVNCLPIADMPVAEADPIIGDRAYGTEWEKVVWIANAMAVGLTLRGVLPIMKHIPGHGRATADSHHKLPVVDTDRATLEFTDFRPFRALHEPRMAMTAHVVFTSIDPLAPATTSATLIREVIRGWIGFRGLLMSDDISMGALSGSIADRSRAAIAAGCDVVLHCNGDLAEMDAVAGAVPPLAGEAATRAEAALEIKKVRPPQTHDLALARAELEALLKQHAQPKGVAAS